MDHSEPITLFTIPAEYGPDWNYQLTTVDIEQTDLTDEGGVPLLGLCDYINRRILINAASPIWVQEMVIVHEMLHSLFDCHGITWLDAEKEEALVTFISPRLLKSLKQIGFKLPKRSKAEDAFCKNAKEENE